jgi:hypothetical protein
VKLARGVGSGGGKLIGTEYRLPHLHGILTAVGLPSTTLVPYFGLPGINLNMPVPPTGVAGGWPPSRERDSRPS